MSKSAADVLKLLKDNEVKFVDLRFTDTVAKNSTFRFRHMWCQIVMNWFESGHAFDGSSIAGWKGIQASDMLLMADPASAFSRSIYGRNPHGDDL